MLGDEHYGIPEMRITDEKGIFLKKSEKLLFSHIRNKNNKLARDAFQNAGNLLSGEDYGEMLSHLSKLVPDFVRENQS